MAGEGTKRGETRVFELLLTGANGHYAATPITASGRGLSVNFMLPEDLAPERVTATLDGVFRSAKPVMLGAADSSPSLQGLGERLATLVLKDAVDVKLRHERRDARSGRLLISLDIQSPELAALPWELLWDAKCTPPGFLGTSRGVVIVRKTPGTDHHDAQPIPLPLRVKVMVASPKGLRELALQHEVDLLKKALARELASGRVVLDEVAGQTAEDLYAALKPGQDPVHIFHFAGHGDFDENRNEGQIILCNAQGEPTPVSASDLATNCTRSGVRFAVLNCCQSATSSKVDLFAAAASAVAGAGVPAVLAMQHPIKDEDAIKLAARVYMELAAGETIAGAVGEARVAMKVGKLAWATPVLYLNGNDGPILPQIVSRVPVPTPVPGPTQKRPNILHGIGVAAQLLFGVALCVFPVSLLLQLEYLSHLPFLVAVLVWHFLDFRKWRSGYVLEGGLTRGLRFVHFAAINLGAGCLCCGIANTSWKSFIVLLVYLLVTCNAHAVMRYLLAALSGFVDRRYDRGTTDS